MQKFKIAPVIKPSNSIILPNKIELPEEKHTEEIHEIITKVPSWIVRWGIMLFFGILLIAEGIAILVHYPDVIKTNLKITSATHSTPVIASTAGTLSKIFVKSRSQVTKGQKLAFIKNGPDSIGYFLTSPMGGSIAFISIIQQGTVVNPGQELFRINPPNENFYGVTAIPQSIVNKVKIGQAVHISITGYPVDEYGQLNGKISFIADEPDKTGLYMVKVLFDKNTELKKPLKLKEWMTGSAEIITEDISLQARVYNNIVRGLR